MESSALDAIKILGDFLPDRLFDAHSHLFDSRFMPDLAGKYPYELGGVQEHGQFFYDLLPGIKDLRLNLIPYPDRHLKGDAGERLMQTDRLLTDELSKNRNNVGEIVVLPGESGEDIEKRLCHPAIKGLKCYHVYADKENTGNCTIDEYLPESAWSIADKRHLCITLHLVRDKALADDRNSSYICRMAKKYPDAVLILAHAARSFASWTAVESIEKVAHLENVWFDFSAVCESPAMISILKKAGSSRCMWGSDFPICSKLGKAISIGSSFYWIYEDDKCFSSFDLPSGFWPIGLENLMAVRQACIIAGLPAREVEDIFYNNASALFDRS